MIYRRFCKSCGVSFTTFYSNQLCHSIPCQIAWSRVRRKAWDHKQYLKRKKEQKAVVFKICLVCHAEYQTRYVNPQLICAECQSKGFTLANRPRL